MPATVSISQSNVLAALREFVLSLISCEVIQGLPNRVSMPKDPFIAMTTVGQMRLATNIGTYDRGVNAANQYQQQSVQLSVQVDCYGPAANDWAVTLTTMLRSNYATQMFTASGFAIQPLYADDPRQLPIVDGEQQYESRWSFNAVLQYNPVVTIPQQFANELAIGLIDVDATYPP